MCEKVCKKQVGVVKMPPHHHHQGEGISGNNPGCVGIMTQKHLDTTDRSESIYEHFSELRSRVSGGSRRPQLARLRERPAYTAAARILLLDSMLIFSTPVMVIEYLRLIHVFLYFSLRYPCALPDNEYDKASHSPETKRVLLTFRKQHRDEFHTGADEEPVV